MSTMRDIYTDLKHKQEENVRENEKLKDKMEEKKKEREESVNIKKMLSHQLKKAATLIGNLTREQDNLHTLIRCKNFKIRQIETTDDIEELCQRKQEVESSLGTRTDMHAELNAQCLKMIGSVQNKEKIILALQNLLKEPRNLLCKLNFDRNFLEQEIVEKTRDRKECRAYLAELDEKKRKMKQNIKDIKIEHLADKLRCLENNFEKTKERIAKEKSDNKTREQEINTLKMKNERLRHNMQDLQHGQKLQRDKIAELKKCVKSCQTDATRVKTEHIAMMQCVNELKKQAVSTQHAINFCTKEHAKTEPRKF